MNAFLIGPSRSCRVVFTARLLPLIALSLGANIAAAWADEFQPAEQGRIVPRDARLELLWNDGEFTEGPAPAGDGAILFSDIGNRILRYDPRSGETAVFRADSGKANGLMFDRQGRLLACEGASGGNRRISITDTSGKIRTLADRFEGKRFNSPNDLAIDANARVYFTDPRYGGDEPRELDFEGVFLVDANGAVKLATRDVEKPNGILVAIDGRTVYVADNNSRDDGNHQLVAFAVQPDGTLADKRVLFDFGPNRRGIDGMTLDRDGNIYATAGRGDQAGVYVFAADGRPLAFIATPGDPTNCVFGAGEQSSTLYITAAGPTRPDGPRRYALYRIQLAIPGHHIFPPGDDSADHEAAVRAIQKIPTAPPIELSEHLTSMVRDDLERRLAEANRRSTEQWHRIADRTAWERFRDRCLASLRDSLGLFPEPPKPLEVRVTGRVEGDGFRIENLVFPSRPGLWVTANLYVPAMPATNMPGILICHSHHRPKDQSELQDMGMTWARAGCLVLVMDQLGHGERQQHPFRSESDYSGSFRVSRQDYYFRYDAGMQLHLAGESLIGWMAWDLMRGVDLLLARDGIDPQRIILLGAVAGGGDPATVTAALDPRIAAAVPFNFGGPQPETRYPLPDDATDRFNYSGSGSWESTRNLRRSAADGFLPWVLAGVIAPRCLSYAHEFSWDRQRDPVWQRLQQIYGWYDAADRLSWVHGSGSVRGSAPESTHCTNIGRLHRTMIHPAFKKWFQLQVGAENEFSDPVEPQRLRCMTTEAERHLQPRGLNELLGDLAAERLGAERRHLLSRSPLERRQWLRDKWATQLGPVDPQGTAAVKLRESGSLPPAGAIVEQITLETEPGILVPLVLLRPAVADKQRPSPIVIAVSQAGGEAFLRERPAELARILAHEVAVCLPDVRGTGQTRSGNDRGQDGADTAYSSTELMLGGTMVGARLRDLRSVMQYLRGREELDARRTALWGQSFAAANPTDTDFDVPRRVDGRPKQSEPLGGLLALFAALYEDSVVAVAIDGGLDGFASVLSSYQVMIPHDVVIPGALTASDLCDIAASLAPIPLRITNAVDGLNRRVPAVDLADRYAAVTAAYTSTPSGLMLGESTTPIADWLASHVAPAK